MNVNLDEREALAAVEAARLRVELLLHHRPGILDLPLTVGWLDDEILSLTSFAEKVDAAIEEEWTDRHAAFNAMQALDMTEPELRAMYGDR